MEVSGGGFGFGLGVGVGTGVGSGLGDGVSRGVMILGSIGWAPEEAPVSIAPAIVPIITRTASFDRIQRPYPVRPAVLPLPHK